MLTKLYVGLSALFALALIAVFAMGSMSDAAIVVFGFLGFGMVFMDMISVLPSSVHQWLGKH